jgi:hypothetical protein
MLVKFINSGTQQDLGIKEVDLQSLRIDGYERPYAIVSNPFSFSDSVRAEYQGEQWVVDLD